MSDPSPFEILQGAKPTASSPSRAPDCSWPSAAEWIETLANAGDPIPTNLPALDLRLRGGMRAGRVCVVGGEPGAGKTALLLQVAGRMAASGAAVVFLARDEGPESAAVRLAQHLGVSREDAERGTPTAIRALVMSTGSGVRLQLPDPDEIRDLREVFEGVGSAKGNRVVILDSIQKVTLSDEPDSLHEAVSARMDAIRKAARETKSIVFVASELARGGYARKDRTSDLASFKNSGGIEYGADVAVVLRPMEQREGDVVATIVKNRLGSKGTFMLRINKDTCLYSEVDEEGERGAQDSAREQAEEGRLTEMCGKILALLEHTPGLNTRQIRAEVSGKTDLKNAAMDRLKDTGRIVPQSGPKNALFWTIAR
jgi:replicative DNA helicase